MMNMVLVIIFIVVLFILIDSTSRYVNQIRIDNIGKDGEKSTKAIVKKIKECEYVLTNLYIPTAKGGVTEIDLVAFTNLLSKMQHM